MGGLASFGLERFEDEYVGGTKTLVTRGMVPSAHCTGLESLRSMATGWVVRCGEAAPRRVVGELPDSAHTHLLVSPIHRQVGCAESTCFLDWEKGWACGCRIGVESERPKEKIPTQD